VVSASPTFSTCRAGTSQPAANCRASASIKAGKGSAAAVASAAKCFIEEGQSVSDRFCTAQIAPGARGNPRLRCLASGLTPHQPTSPGDASSSANATCGGRRLRCQA
jgi:hypothetical protein